jgi:hypothetical protein
MQRDTFGIEAHATFTPSNVVMTVLLRGLPFRPSIEDVSRHMFLAHLIVNTEGCDYDIHHFINNPQNFIASVKLLEQCVLSVRIDSIKPNPAYFNVPSHVYHWLGNVAHRIVSNESTARRS